MGAGCLALVENQSDEAVDDAVQVFAPAGRRPRAGRAGRVRGRLAWPRLRQPGDGGLLVVGSQRTVALPDGGVHRGQDLRDAQVVVHSLGEGGGTSTGGSTTPPAFSTTRCTKPSIREHELDLAQRLSEEEQAVSLAFPRVIAATILPGPTAGAHQGAVDEDDVATLSGGFPRHALKALGPGGEEFDESRTQRRTVEAEIRLPPAMAARRWSWRRTASTIVAIFPGDNLRDGERIFFR